jgi:hypothetical protein
VTRNDDDDNNNNSNNNNNNFNDLAAVKSRRMINVDIINTRVEEQGPSV